jgi:prophage regulatory protein
MIGLECFYHTLGFGSHSAHALTASSIQEQLRISHASSPTTIHFCSCSQRLRTCACRAIDHAASEPSSCSFRCIIAAQRNFVKTKTSRSKRLGTAPSHRAIHRGRRDSTNGAPKAGNANRTADTTTIRILRLPDVCRVTGLSRAMIYRLQGQRKFPESVKLTEHAVGWIASEVEAWLLGRAAARRGGAS